jgi:adenylosuccinate synthase
MVIHLPTLLEEIQILKDAGIDIVPRLHIAGNAHIVFEYHKEIDGVLEERRSKGKSGAIGTTRRGIGPAYADKVLRSGLRMETLQWPADRARTALAAAADNIERMFGVQVNTETEMASITSCAAVVSSRIVTKGPALIHAWLTQGKRMLLEGAQATLLDIDHGTYPFVTSSQTTLAGALQGLGVAPRHMGECIGVAKAYCTRVGSGMFPTEADEAASQRLRDRGGEYGSVTKRPRRCGWLSIPDLRYSAMINGFHCWNITKLDVLDTEETIPVCTGEGADGAMLWTMFPGWKTSTAGITEWDKLPSQARDLILFIEKETGIPVRYLKTGQGREEMMVR